MNACGLPYEQLVKPTKAPIVVRTCRVPALVTQALSVYYVHRRLRRHLLVGFADERAGLGVTDTPLTKIPEPSSTEGSERT